MILHIFLFMAVWLAAAIGISIAMSNILEPAKKKEKTENKFPNNLKFHIGQLKKSFFKRIYHKLFPHKILFTAARVADDNLRMVLEVYRYDMDASMRLVVPKKNILDKFESSIIINDKFVNESVIQYNTKEAALESFRKFCYTKFDLYQHVFNHE